MYVLNPLTARLNYVETPKNELQEFFRRFLIALGPRTEILADVVRTDASLACWSPDMTPASLETLGAWFMSNMHTRPRTEAEIFAIASKSPYALPVPPRTLTDQTFSLAADVGIYFARVLM